MLKKSDANPPLVLIADDHADIREALRFLLKGEGIQLIAADSPKQIFEEVSRRDFDLALIDLNYTRDTTSGAEGLDALARIKAIDAALPVIVLTAWGSVEIAVEAMRRGAGDFVQKPWENERLLSIVQNQIQLGRAVRRNERLEAENRLLRDERAVSLVAESPAMQPVLQIIERVATSDANILVTGENGTGKGLIAQAIHAASHRSDKSLVTVNAGGLSEGLFESEIFGHVKGAFTDAKQDRVGRFELAAGGTLFLDEIANVPLSLQAKLLRVLETGEFERVGSSRTQQTSARIISATNADLDVEVAAGRFRQDLLFRLNTIEIHLPPLRERREDIPPLARHFLTAHARQYRKDIEGFEVSALNALLGHAWPGNVRELGHVIERSVLMTQGPRIRVEDLGLRNERPGSPRLEDLSLEEVESILIRKALARFDGNVSHAAELLGLSRSALYRRIQRYGL
jgi:DNA-binding NtrC family response regulator